jgi:hypothetical protein
MSKIYKQFQQVVDNTFADLTGKILLKTGNIYVLYNQYAIVKKDDGATVVRRRDDFEINFYSVKNALTWAILDSRDKFYDAARVKELDMLLESVKVDRQIHENLRKRGTLEQRSINTNKLQLDIERQKRFIAEIDKYTITANHCHQRGIRNEPNRTSKK